MDDRILEEANEEYLSSLSGQDTWPISEAIFERPLSELKKRPCLVMDVSETIANAAREMVGMKIGSVIATRDGILVGFLTERNLVNRMVNKPFDPKETAIEDLMVRKVVTVPAHATVAYAIHQMSSGGYRHLPIVDPEHRPVGIVSVRDIVDYLAVLFPHKILTQPPDAQKIPPTREGG